MEHNKALVIQKIGTDSTSSITVSIDKKEVLDINYYVGNDFPTSSQMLGPLDLGQYYLVVPPNMELEFSSASNMRLIGKIIHLEPNETLPTDLVARFNEQVNRRLYILSGSYTISGGTTWSSGEELELIDKTLETNEEMILDGFIGFYTSDTSTVDPGNVGIRLYVNDVFLDNAESTMAPFGINAQSIYTPVSTSINIVPGTLKDMPIELKGDYKFKATMINLGSDISPAADVDCSLYIVAKYLRKI